MSRVLLCLLLFLAAVHGNAQSPLTSFFTKADTAKSDTTKIEALCLMAWEMRKTDHSLANQLLDSIEYLLDDVVEYEFGRPNIFMIRANIMGHIGREKDMIEYYDKAILLYNIYTKHPNKFIQERAKQKQSTCYNNLAETYLNNGQYRQALNLYQKSLAGIKNSGNKQQISIRYSNLGFTYIDYGNLDSAEFYLLKCYELESELNDLNGFYWANYGLGKLYSAKKDFEQANKYFKRALEIAMSLNNTYLEMEAYSEYANALSLQGEFQEATNNYLRSLKLARQIEALPFIENLLGEISKLYHLRENYKLAAEYYRNYIAIKDTIYANSAEEQLAKFQAQFEAAEKEQQIRLLQKDKLLAEKQQRIFIGGIIGAIAIIILVANQFRISRKNNLKLIEKNKTIRSQNREILEINHQLTDSIAYAKKIQQAILPSENDFKDHFGDGFAWLYPKNLVSGDFYWIYPVENSVLFCVADCTGHGVPGALMSVIGNNLLDKIVIEHKITQPNKILDALNQMLHEKLSRNDNHGVKDGMDLMLCNYDKENNILTASGAYNLLYHISDGELNTYKGDQLHLGDTEHTLGKKYSLISLDVKQGDCLYLFSDGFADQKGGKHEKKFYYPPFRKLLLDNHSMPMGEQKEQLVSTFRSWKGNLEQVDDVCVVGIRI